MKSEELPPIPPIKCADDIEPHQEAVLIWKIGIEPFRKLERMAREKKEG